MGVNYKNFHWVNAEKKEGLGQVLEYNDQRDTENIFFLLTLLKIDYIIFITVLHCISVPLFLYAYNYFLLTVSVMICFFHLL